MQQNDDLTFIQRIGVVTIILVILYVILDVFVQLLPPHYNIISQAESDLAVGPYGYIMTMNFVIRGIGSLCLLVGIWQYAKKDKKLLFGTIFFGMWAIGSIILALFPADVTSKVHIHGIIHLIVAAIAFIVASIGAILLSHTLVRVQLWQGIKNVLLASAYISFVLLLLFFHTSRGRIAGLTERLFLLSLLWWIFLVALYMIRIPQGNEILVSTPNPKNPLS